MHNAGSADCQAPVGAGGVGKGGDVEELTASFDAIFEGVIAEPIGLDGGEGAGGP